MTVLDNGDMQRKPIADTALRVQVQRPRWYCPQGFSGRLAALTVGLIGRACQGAFRAAPPRPLIMPMHEHTDARSSYGLNARFISLATFLRRLSPVQSLAVSAIAVAASRWMSM